MNALEKNFVAQLAEFLKAQNVTLEGYDQYDGGENFEGEVFRFVGEGIYIDIEDAMNIVNPIVKEFNNRQ